MRVFKSKSFNKFSTNEGISDEQLANVVREMEDGVFEADLGGCVYKKRIATQGQGKSGSTRNIIAMKENDRVIFMIGYKKNTVKKSGKEITDKELRELKSMAQAYFRIDLNKVKPDSKALIEVKYERYP